MTNKLHQIIECPIVADIKIIASSQGRRPKVAGPSGYFRQDLLLISGGGIKFDNILAAGNIYFASTGDQLPGLFPGIALTLGVYFCFDGDIFLGKNRPGFLAGCSPFTHIRPVYSHDFLLLGRFLIWVIALFHQRSDRRPKAPYALKEPHSK